MFGRRPQHRPGTDAAPERAGPASDAGAAPPSVLNVGGNSKSIPIPPHYGGWDQRLLDIDPRRGVDIVCDARELLTLAPGQFDAVYCSHNLEHYYRHEVPRVLAGFRHVLKADGFAEVRVPDLPAVFRKALEDGIDLADVLYESPAGPIAVIDVLYGWGREIEESGNDFYAHKTGFSRKSLGEALLAAGFADVWEMPPFSSYELRAIAFKIAPSPAQRGRLGLPPDGPSARA